MGFSSALQGPASHDAILLRIDAELRLLENMRRCVSLRIKSDRKYFQIFLKEHFVKEQRWITLSNWFIFENNISGEYAISLNSFVLQAQKMESTELCGSHVAKGNYCSHYVDMIAIQIGAGTRRYSYSYSYTPTSPGAASCYSTIPRLARARLGQGQGT